MLKAGVLLVFAFLLTLFIVPLFINLSHRLGVLDHPDHRKIHDSATPTLGGMAIFISFLVVYVLFAGIDDSSYNYLIAASIVVMLTGLIDDLFSLGAWKFLGQLVAVLILIKGGFIISNLGNLFGFGVVDLGNFSALFTIFSCLGVINAVNLIDGMDGLAGGVALLSFVCMMMIGIDSSNQQVVLLCACAGGATLGFLVFNFNPAKIFMGDAGSNLLGLLLASFAIRLTNGGNALVEPIVPAAIMFIPIFDTIIVMIGRLMNGRWPFVASNDHIHHKLLAIGLSQRQTWAVLIMASLFVDAFVILIYKHVCAYTVTYVMLSAVMLLFGSVEFVYIKKTGGSRATYNV